MSTDNRDIIKDPARRAKYIEIKDEIYRLEGIRGGIQEKVQDKWMSREEEFSLDEPISKCVLQVKSKTLRIDLYVEGAYDDHDSETDDMKIGFFLADDKGVVSQIGDIQTPMGECDLKSHILDCHKLMLNLLMARKAEHSQVEEMSV